MKMVVTVVLMVVLSCCNVRNFMRNLDAIAATFERRMKLQLHCLDFRAD